MRFAIIIEGVPSPKSIAKLKEDLAKEGGIAAQLQEFTDEFKDPESTALFREHMQSGSVTIEADFSDIGEGSHQSTATFAKQP